MRVCAFVRVCVQLCCAGSAMRTLHSECHVFTALQCYSLGSGEGCVGWSKNKHTYPRVLPAGLLSPKEKYLHKVGVGRAAFE